MIMSFLELKKSSEDFMVDKERKMENVGWNGNMCVNVTSNTSFVSPTIAVLHYRSKGNAKVWVQQPDEQKQQINGGCRSLCQEYKLLQNLYKNKLWCALFHWLTDMMIQSTWLLYSPQAVRESPFFDMLVFK